jgi:hypothetical protein
VLLFAQRRSAGKAYAAFYLRSLPNFEAFSFSNTAAPLKLGHDAISHASMYTGLLPNTASISNHLAFSLSLLRQQQPFSHASAHRRRNEMPRAAMIAGFISHS